MRILSFLFVFFLVYSPSPLFSQVLKQKNLNELQTDLTKIDKSIETTLSRLKTIREAKFLPDLYLVLAELYTDKARYMYQIKTMKNRGVPFEELDFANEKRPKMFAIETYQKLIDKFPSFRDRDKAFFFMAHEYRELGQFEEMVQTYQKLTTQYPQSIYFAESLVIIGTYFFETKKDFDKALGYFKQVLNLKDSPFIPVARYKIGWIHINKGQFVDSLLSFEGILTKDKNIDYDKLPDIYKKTDVRRDAITAIAWPYSEIAPNALKKMGEGREDAIEYFKNLSNEKITYQKALSRLGRRLSIKQRYVTSTKVYFELLKMTKNLELRIESIEKLYEAMKNSLKDWPVYGFTEVIADTINQVRFSRELNEKQKFQHDKNFEIYSRDAATRAQMRAKETKKSDDYRLAISAYKAYLWVYPNTKFAGDLRLNLAETYFNLKDYINAGREYEMLARSTKTMQKRKSYLDSSLESYTSALKNPENLNRFQTAQGRNGIRDVGLYYVKSFPEEKAVPSILFNAGRAYYDERDFKNSDRVLFDYLRKYPKGADAALTVDLILDAYNQREDYKGFAIAGQKILKMDVATSIKTNVTELIKQAELRKIQTNITDFSGDVYSKQLLEFAAKYKGTNLGDRALFEAFNALKSKKDPGAYIPGEELLLKHGNSQYAKEVTLEMGKMSLLTADFRRAAKYFEIFSSKYPKDSESKNLLKNAATMRETMGDLEQAQKNYLNLGDRRSAARVDFAGNQWTSLLSSAQGLSGPEANYYLGLAHYRLGQKAKAKSYLDRTSKGNGSSFEEKTWQAHALYLLSMDAVKAYKTIQLQAGNEAQAVANKTKSLQNLTAQLNRVIQSGNGRWTIAALYGLGQVNKEFADFIKRAPMPQGLTPDQQKQYRTAIAGQAKTYEVTAKKFFTECMKNSEKFEVFTNFVKGCQSNGDILVDEESETQVLVQAAEQTPPATFGIRKKLYDNSRDTELLFKLSQAYAEGRDYSMAVLICDRAIEISPQFSPCHALKGVSYMFMNNLELAFSSFKNALKLNPNQPTALWGMAGLYKEFGFTSKIGPSTERARRSGSPSQPIHPFVRAIRL